MHYKTGMHTPTTLPHVSPAEITLELGPGPLRLWVGPTSYTMPLELSAVVQRFGHALPAALQLENAIAKVEDAIMPVGQHLPAGAQVLCTDDTVLRELIHAATGQPEALSASRAAIEALFSDLARQAQGGAHAVHLPATPQAAAALLIVRECMHHWGMQVLEYRFGITARTAGAH